MNDKIQHNNEEDLLRKYFTETKIEPPSNVWFTKRVMHKLPHRFSSIERNIMTVVTIISVVMCGILLYYSTDYILPHAENKITLSLLCIYVTIISTMVLVLLQIIRLIKTYF